MFLSVYILFVSINHVLKFEDMVFLVDSNGAPMDVSIEIARDIVAEDSRRSFIYIYNLFCCIYSDCLNVILFLYLSVFYIILLLFILFVSVFHLFILFLYIPFLVVAPGGRAGHDAG